VLTLALGIGANTAISTILDSVLLCNLPVPHPEELSILTDPNAHGVTIGGYSTERSTLAYSEFQYLRDHNDVFSHSSLPIASSPKSTMRDAIYPGSDRPSPSPDGQLNQLFWLKAFASCRAHCEECGCAKTSASEDYGYRRKD